MDNPGIGNRSPEFDGPNNIRNVLIIVYFQACVP